MKTEQVKKYIDDLKDRAKRSTTGELVEAVDEVAEILVDMLQKTQQITLTEEQQLTLGDVLGDFCIHRYLTAVTPGGYVDTLARQLRECSQNTQKGFRVRKTASETLSLLCVDIQDDRKAAAMVAIEQMKFMLAWHKENVEKANV